MTASERHFIVIDDNKLDCFIAEKMILRTGLSNSIRLFFEAGAALRHIEQHTPADNGQKTIIIVDIQMPLMNGFDFVEAFEHFPEAVQNKYVIFVLSSSINENDRRRARNLRSVRQLLNKPLTTKSLQSLIDQFHC